MAHGVPPGVGGLGHHAAHVLTTLADHVDGLRLYGPDAVATDRSRSTLARVPPPEPLVATWRRRYTWLRFLTGRYQLAMDRRFGAWLASELARKSFRRGYFFTQIARESLILARENGALTILDNPNGHIRDFREQLCRESMRWIGWPYLGHPNEVMVKRVEEEYRLADRIRVSSEWAKRSLVMRGVDDRKIFVVPQAIDLNRFVPIPKEPSRGPLRLVFVGSFSLGKGFQYLLRAMERVGPRRVSVTMIGATGDPWCHRLLKKLKAGLDVVHEPGDPVGAYQGGELFVFPSLHDGFGLVLAEAMACGLPVLTTHACGASESVVNGESGWVVPRGDEDALVAALETALLRRNELRHMGRAARRVAEQLNADAINHKLRECISKEWDIRQPTMWTVGA